MSSKITRRTFGKAAAGLAAAASLKASVVARAAGANEKFNVGLIGCGGMGQYKLGNFCDSGRVNIVALCDVDPTKSADAAAIVGKAPNQQPKPKQTKNYHDVINDKSIDIVIVATPDHWHAAPMMLACQAGKDIYCEKPCSHNIREAQAMLKAAQKYKRVVQVGTHQRSMPHIQAARDYIQQGKLGLISMTNTFTYGNNYPSTNLGNAPDTAPPEGVDYNTWLGPASVRPFNTRRFHNTWRWYFDYGCGMVGDWNVHLQDIIMWTMGVKAPVAVCTSGGHLLLKDDRDTPDVMQSVYEFAPTPLAPGGFVQTYTMRKTSGKPWSAGGYGMDFSGTNGLIHLTRNEHQLTADREDWEKPGDPPSPFRVEGFKTPHPDADKEGHPAHVKNFLDCVANRKPPIAAIESHYHSVVACHLASVSLKLGRGCVETGLLGDVKLKQGNMNGIAGGRKIYWDAEKALCYKDPENKIEDKEANALLGREYRKGFELPNV